MWLGATGRERSPPVAALAQDASTLTVPDCTPFCLFRQPLRCSAIAPCLPPADLTSFYNARRWAPSSDNTRGRSRDQGARLNTLAGGHPLRTGDNMNSVILFVSVSIPSQVGTLFGPIVCDGNLTHKAGLNTLAGGHPLRTDRQSPLVALLPPGLNTLAGGHPLRTGYRLYEAEEDPRLNTLAGGHPLRTVCRVVFSLTISAVSIPSQVGTLFGPPRK
jgi:hypothetical protein